jgi:peptidyl-prolyl cis-trans isomerase A (cyclophilin A)
MRFGAPPLGGFALGAFTLGALALGALALGTPARAAGSSASASASASSFVSCTTATENQTGPNPRVRVTTNMGSFVIELYKERAPFTVYDFCRYVEKGQYTNTLFHRVIANFVIQGGGHDATPPEYRLKPVDRPIPNESGNGLQNKRGMVGLARAAKPHSGNAQFYINLVDNPELDPVPTRWGYAVFGQVIQGMDVVDRIGVTPTGSNCPGEKATDKDKGKGGAGSSCPFQSDWPIKPVVIESISELAPGAELQEAPTAVSPNSTTPPVDTPR